MVVLPVPVVVDVAVVDEDCVLGVVLRGADGEEEGVGGFGVREDGFGVLGWGSE